MPLRSNDGTTRWVLVSASLLSGEADGASQVACVMMDVTDRRHAEERLRHSEAQYRVLAETAEDLIFVGFVVLVPEDELVDERRDGLAARRVAGGRRCGTTAGPCRFAACR